MKPTEERSSKRRRTNLRGRVRCYTAAPSPPSESPGDALEGAVKPREKLRPEPREPRGDRPCVTDRRGTSREPREVAPAPSRDAADAETKRRPSQERRSETSHLRTPRSQRPRRTGLAASTPDRKRVAADRRPRDVEQSNRRASFVARRARPHGSRPTDVDLDLCAVGFKVQRKSNRFNPGVARPLLPRTSPRTTNGGLSCETLTDNSQFARAAFSNLAGRDESGALHSRKERTLNAHPNYARAERIVAIERLAGSEQLKALPEYWRLYDELNADLHSSSEVAALVWQARNDSGNNDSTEESKRRGGAW